jgi:hypothetical protein
MPKGKPVDQDQAVQTLKQIRQAMARGTPAMQALQQAGISESNYSRWKRRFGHLLDTPAPTDETQPRRRVVHRRRRASAHAPGSGRGPAPRRSGLVAPDQRRRMHRENEELRGIVIDQALLIARLQKASRN